MQPEQPNQPETNNASLRYILPSIVTIDTVDEISEGIKSLPLTSDATLVLDVSVTEIITTPGVQLLIAASKSVGNFRVESQNPAIAQAFEDLGLSSHLAQWEKSHD